MAITSKEISIILIEIILAGMVAYLFQKINISDIIYQLKDSISIILLVILVAAALIFVFYRKINEVNEELEKLKNEQKRLDEKLKIYNRLAKLEKRCFK